jgi:UDP-glucose 4-epimerase
MAHVVTGGAGFIACNLIPRLLERGITVYALDNLVRGRREFLDSFMDKGRLRFLSIDCSDKAALRRAFEQVTREEAITDVWHLAANSDIPAGVADPTVDLKDTFLTTFATLVVMAEFEVRRIHFASSSAIYGDHSDVPISENTAPCFPISNYGAMKLASEAQISAAVETFLDQANIFRFPNVVGPPATHGVIIDFIGKLRATPDVLDVLGNGAQQKSYLHVEDLISAMLFIADQAQEPRTVFNIGPEDFGVTVRFIAETVRDAVAPGSEIRFGEGDRGWVGDVPRFRYDCKQLAALGWRPNLTSEGAVRRAVADIVRQELGR